VEGASASGEGALVYYTFATLTAAGVKHAVFTRLGGQSHPPFASLNVGHTVSDDLAHVEANHQIIYRALGVRAEQVVTVHQVHSANVVALAPGDGGKLYPATDALLSNVPGLMALLRFADCVPVLFYAPRPRAVALAHAGWQGTLAEIAAHTAQAMMARYGCAPTELRVGIGPAIGPCCFEIGPEVVERVRRLPSAAAALRPHAVPGKAYLDLEEANARQLLALGITHIERAQRCTCCHRDEFYSHRGEQGRTGRFAALIGLEEE
jgi:hypothetical protein